MHERWWLRRAAIAAVPLAAAVLTGCESTPSPVAPPSPTTAAARTSAAKPIPYNLYTHCGIDYAQVGNRYYEIMKRGLITARSDFGPLRAYGATRASVRGLMAARLAARLSGRPYRAAMAAGVV